MAKHGKVHHAFANESPDEVDVSLPAGHQLRYGQVVNLEAPPGGSGRILVAITMNSRSFAMADAARSTYSSAARSIALEDRLALLRRQDTCKRARLAQPRRLVTRGAEQREHVCQRSLVQQLTPLDQGRTR